MTILSQFIKTDPFIVIGSSLDEMDLDYYMAQRTTTSGRDDWGPSILVEPYPDDVTKNDCERFGFLLFKGTSTEFLKYCEEVATNRPTPYELIPSEARKILPENVEKKDALAFWADFELVPGTAEKIQGPTRFMYGHPPSWSDLESTFDISRSCTRKLLQDIETNLKEPTESHRLLLLVDDTGKGKSTVLRRTAFELARRGGIIVLNCTALSRLEPVTTAKLIDQIDKPVVLIIDNFADQATAVSDVLSRLKKSDVVMVGAERAYRLSYVKQVLSGIRFTQFKGLDLNQYDITRLVDKYQSFGLVGSEKALKRSTGFMKDLVSDPIAIACCRILNDFRPLDRIIAKNIEDCDSEEQDRYYMSALAQHCYRGGLSYAILARAAGSNGLKDQIRQGHPLALAYVQDQSNSFIVPQNATLSNRVLRVISEAQRERLLGIFINLANEIAPRVNRIAIKDRLPEARLAGRLFDYDSIVQDLIGDFSPKFYAATQRAWQWNSRYWEQIALLKISEFHRSTDIEERTNAIESAVQYARHAVSIEFHPFPLTTLSKILIVFMNEDGASLTSAYSEAYDNLMEAIRIERSWSRAAVQPFVTLFKGSREFIEWGGSFSSDQQQSLQRLLVEAKEKFPRDEEVQRAIDELNHGLYPHGLTRNRQ